MRSAAIELDNATVRFGGHTVWRTDHITIAAGSLIAVIGSNGAGKTVLMKALLGQLPLAAGSVRVLGTAPRRGDRRISLVAQRAQLTADLVIRGSDLVTLGIAGHRWGLGGPTAAERRAVADAIEAVDATAYAHRPVGILSGGQQQRLFIAEALLPGLEVLLLDEPLAGLDLRAQDEVVGLLRDLNHARGITTVVVTHDLNPLIPILDGVIAVADGSVRSGSVETMIESDFLSRLYGTTVEALAAPDGRRFVRGLPSGHRRRP